MRQIILDTETTGLDPAEGHRIIEIGCVEMVNRRLTGNNYHQYLQPDRAIDVAAIEIHGITNESLTDKPRFADIAQDFLDYMKGAELVIHNAPFDVGFLNSELVLMAMSVSGGSGGDPKIEDSCSVVDTLKLARSLHPGQKNDLDSLCKRYSIDNSQRTLHGALLDAEILADVYLAMTGGQTGLFEDSHSNKNRAAESSIRRITADRPRLRVIHASEEELALHHKWLEELDTSSEGKCIWKKIETTH